MWLLVFLQAGQAVGQGRRRAQVTNCKEASLSEVCRCRVSTRERGLLASRALRASLACLSPGPATEASSVEAGMQTWLNESRTWDDGGGGAVFTVSGSSRPCWNEMNGFWCSPGQARLELSAHTHRCLLCARYLLGKSSLNSTLKEDPDKL